MVQNFHEDEDTWPGAPFASITSAQIWLKFSGYSDMDVNMKSAKLRLYRSIFLSSKHFDSNLGLYSGHVRHFVYQKSKEASVNVNMNPELQPT